MLKATILSFVILLIPLLWWVKAHRSRSRSERLAMELMERRRKSFYLIFGKLPDDPTLTREAVSKKLNEVNRQSVRASWNRNRFISRGQHNSFLKARRLASQFGFSIPADMRVITGERRREAR
jgi:hypothetical protein